MTRVPNRIANLDYHLVLGDGLNADIIDTAAIQSAFVYMMNIRGEAMRFDYVGAINTSCDRLLGGLLRLSVHTSIHIDRVICGFHDGVFSYECLEYAKGVEAKNCLPLSIWERMTDDDMYQVSENFAAPEWLGDHVRVWLQTYHAANGDCFDFREGY